MSDTRLNQLIINKLTKAQYDALPQETKESNQLFFTTDEVPLDSSDIATTINSSSTNSKAAGALAVYNYHDSTKQNSITSSNKLSADLVVNGSTNKVVTQTEKNTWNNKSTVIASTSTVSGATTAQSLSINGSNWNLGGDNKICMILINEDGNTYQFTVPSTWTWNDFIDSEYNTAEQLGGDLLIRVPNDQIGWVGQLIYGRSNTNLAYVKQSHIIMSCAYFDDEF